MTQDCSVPCDILHNSPEGEAGMGPGSRKGDLKPQLAVRRLLGQ